MPQPAVSILIPAYNAGPWLAECVQSALDQTHVPAEVLVWNDGSTDNSAEILRHFGNSIRSFDAPNAGGNRVRNRLLEASTGEWVQFLDADDALLPDKIERQLREAAPLDEVDVIYSPTIDETWADSRRVSAQVSMVDTRQDLPTQWLAWQLSQANGSLWRRSAIVAIGGWNEDQPCCQDNELYARALRAGLRFRFAPSARSIYRIWSGGSVSSRDPVRVVRERTRLMDAMSAWLKSEGRWQVAHARAAGQAFFEMARTWAQHDLGQAADYLAERRRHGPVCARGPAAPLGYRTVYHLGGFRVAERIARRWSRHRQSHSPSSNTAV